ncbi:MAG TPA: hypothetical protein VH593_01250 [Ktedonobacteraceae bacterium]
MAVYRSEEQPPRNIFAILNVASRAEVDHALASMPLGPHFLVEEAFPIVAV